MQTLLLIDGNAIMHRAYYAIPANFKTKDGTPTNAVYGFMTMLAKAIADFQPEYIIICFDTPKPTFRKKLYANYQAHRPKSADTFITQIPLIKEMLEKAGITQIEKEGYEADDIIGTIATRNEDKYRILILTGDKDIMQLVDENVFVMSPQTGISTIKLFDKNEVENKLGVTPEKIPDLKGLMGDASDNYGGAKGIGPKTAQELISRFQSVENLLENVSKVENARTQQIIKTHRDVILLSKRLATIECDAPVNLNVESTRFTGFPEELKNFLNSLEMYTLAERLYAVKAPPKNESKKKESPKKDIIQEDLFS